MITIHWVLSLPPGLSKDEYDDWYLNTHTKYGKNSPGIIRYCVNRVVALQPEVARGAAFRVAEECWHDFEAAELSWNLPLGHAVLGDAVANLGMLDAASMPGIAVTRDKMLDVANPARFSSLRRGFRDREDGTISKFLAFGMAHGDPEIGSWYEATFGELGLDPRVREHIFGTSIHRRLQVGRLVTIPGDPDQCLYDWALELWFDNNDDARAFLSDASFTRMWGELEQRSSKVNAALYRGQEMLIVGDPVAHRDD